MIGIFLAGLVCGGLIGGFGATAWWARHWMTLARTDVKRLNKFLSDAPRPEHL